MKKNYIAGLKEYDARMAPKAKLDKYRKKFTKTLYEKDKQNMHPNIPQSQQLKKTHKDKKEQINTKYKSTQNSRQNTQNNDEKIEDTRTSFATKKKEGRSKQLLRDEYGYLKMQCVLLQRQLGQKQEEEVEKCRRYYGWIYEELQQQERRCVDMIGKIYTEAIEAVDKVDLKLDIDMRANVGQPSAQVELDLAEVVLGDETRSKIREQIQQLDIVNLISCDGEQKSLSSMCGLECSEELKDDSQDFDHRPTLTRKWYQNKYFDHDCPVVYEATESQEGVSPSFKQF